MAWYASSSVTSTVTSTTTTASNWLEEFNKRNAEGLAAAGVPIVDFRTETPNTHLSTIFQCTSALKGRLTPYPYSPHLYILDFVSNEDGIRVEQTTGLAVYDVGMFGEDEPQELWPQGSETGRRGKVDLFILNPGRVCEIRHLDNQKLLKTVSFVYTSRVNICPCIS